MTSGDDVCARCGGAFHCGMRDAAPCACTTVRLDASTLAQLRERYVGCLCLACLRALQDEDVVRVQPGT
ncbi:MAG TPA: cysteine-rich CWC family protein [Albitalea sp.]|uniref:cysteine-rich CWC family protein n=1 Tax=Piscinibacter sp. TaxID=1903157 RepID=UPI002ED14651